MGRASSSVKRLVDICGSLLVLILLSPLWIAVSVAIVLSNGRPVIFHQERVGRDFKPFTVRKFRTMYKNNDDTRHRERNSLEVTGQLEPDENGLYKDADDPRITPVGRLLRRFSIDEVPQLFNVLRGEMSLVGPRPSLQWEVELYEPEYLIRQRVKPGLTGLWQVEGRNLLDMRSMLALDAEYARTRSTMLDLKILAKTPIVVLTGRGAR